MEVLQGGGAEWSDGFDAASVSAADVITTTPTMSPQIIGALEMAISQYSEMVSRGGWPVVPATQKLRIGMRDPAVAILRQRLAISGDLPSAAMNNSDAFDSYVEAAVRRFQARHGIQPDGILGEATFAALNIPAHVRLTQLSTNLTRLKVLTAKPLPARFVMVNIPAAQIEAVENGRVVSRHTAIVGKIDRQSPILNSKIYEVILNPYWTAPRSIIQKDIMPLMRKDPTYLERNAIRLLDGSGNEVSPETIDWNAEKAPNLMFRQDPGKINAMSSTKINFHNEHAVYMHDTPQQGLFNKLMRFESSGCVRVQNVRDLSTWLLKETPGWSRQQMEATIRTGTNTPIKLAEEVPVYFTYITAWAAKDGVVQFRDDIYQRDGATELALQTPYGIEQSAGAVDADALPQ